MSEASFNHESTSEIVCPWCGYEHGDSWEFYNEEGTDFCDDCEKPFWYTRYTEVTYDTGKQW